MTVINYPGPYEVRLVYTVAGLTHMQRLNCRIAGTPAPGTPFSSIDILLADDTTDTLENQVDLWVALIQPFLSGASSDIVRAELWVCEADSFASDYVSSYDIALPGTSGGVYTPAGQWIYTFRTTEGGVMKVSIMEAVVTPGVSLTAPYTGSSLALANFVIDSNAPWLGRDTSYPFANIAAHPGQNESVFKRRFRQL